MTPAQALIAQFDASLHGDVQLVIWEHRRPGAIAALKTWATAHNISVLEYDLRDAASATSFVVSLYPDHDTITIYRSER